MFESLDATATSFPTPTTGTAGRSALPDSRPFPADVESCPADHHLARLLDSTDPMALSGRDRVRYVQAAERLTAHVQAQALTGISAVANSYQQLELDEPEHAYDGTVFELRAALCWTRRYAETELDLATDLLVRLPAVLKALSAGRIDKRRAKIIVSDTSNLSVAHARQVADQILGNAETLTTGQLRARIRRTAIDTDPDSIREQQKKAVADRQFTSWTEPDGTMAIQVTGIDPLRGQELLNRIAHQMRVDGEKRTMDQLRADIAIDLLTGTEHPTIGSIHLTVDPARLTSPELQSAVTLFLPPRPQAVWGEYGEAGRGAVPTHDGPRERWTNEFASLTAPLEGPLRVPSVPPTGFALGGQRPAGPTPSTPTAPSPGTAPSAPPTPPTTATRRSRRTLARRDFSTDAQ